MTSPELEGRVRLLEASIDVQEQILAAMQAERIEADRLQESVGRLGEGASALGAALLQVDKNQQTLTQLGRQLNEVEEKSATLDDLDLAKKALTKKNLEFRKQALARITTTGLLLGLVLAGGLVFFLEYGARQDRELQKTCLARQFASATVNTFTDSQIAIEQDNQFVDADVRSRRIESLRTLGSAFPSPKCEGSP